jgi:hypothetical protein
MRPTGQPIGMTITDSAGNFIFDNVEPGSYTIHVEIDGFEKIDQDFDFADGFAGGTATVLVAPRRLGPAATGQGGKIDVSEYQSAIRRRRLSFSEGNRGQEEGKNDQATKSFEQAIDVAPNFYAHNALGKPTGTRVARTTPKRNF